MGIKGIPFLLLSWVEKQKVERLLPSRKAREFGVFQIFQGLANDGGPRTMKTGEWVEPYGNALVNPLVNFERISR